MCDSFAGMFGSNTKPSAAIYNMAREDLEHAIKFGTSLHGEVFCGKLRLCRHDGAPHKEALPVGRIPTKVGGMEEDGQMWTLRDAMPGEFLPTFPELELNLAITDGCSSQVSLLMIPFPS